MKNRILFKNSMIQLFKNCLRRAKGSMIQLLFIIGFLCSCDSFLDPVRDGSYTEDEIFRNSWAFTGPLNAAYDALTAQFDVAMDAMTDNSVWRAYSGDYYLCGAGALNPNRNPLNNWNNAYQQIRRINQFLEKMVLNDDPDAPYPTPVLWYYNPMSNNLREFNRLLGEAYFLRALYLSDLLKNFAGVTADGIVLGVPLVGDRVVRANEDLNIPRSPFMDCVQAIIDDCDIAIEKLPVQYTGTDAVTGQRNNGRASGIAAMALKARVLLYAASPAFNKDNDISRWEKAAIAAGEAIKSLTADGSLQDLISAAKSADDDLGTMYYFGQMQNATWNDNGRDLFFRANVQTANTSFEVNNYPPSMYGNAQNNPSQNYVDAFPDVNGFPIDSTGTLFNPAKPFDNREPRLALWVGYNGNKMGRVGHIVETFEGGVDEYDPLQGTSRTGYYLRKLLCDKTINLAPNATGTNNTSRCNIILGKPELYLTFAEAANEAWGPTGNPMGYKFHATDVLEAVIKKYYTAANWTATKPKHYLTLGIGGSNEKFRNYVRIYRRLDLSFEGHYYYDLRRWIPDGKTNTLNVDVYGAGKIIKKSDNTFEYSAPVVLEKRYFRSAYPPIPYMELYNAKSIKQNAGWE